MCVSLSTVCVFIRMCKCACDMAGGHTFSISPAEFLTQNHHKSRKDLHQTDYRTAAMTASNGKNKTPFNEDANLRNITLCSEI